MVVGCEGVGMMSEEFVPSRGRKRCPDCGKGVGVRTKVCKYCSHKFSDFPIGWNPAINFIATCGGIAQARVELREAEKFLDQMLEFKRKYVDPKSDVTESDVTESDVTESDVT